MHSRGYRFDSASFVRPICPKARQEGPFEAITSAAIFLPVLTLPVARIGTMRRAKLGAPPGEFDVDLTILEVQDGRRGGSVK